MSTQSHEQPTQPEQWQQEPPSISLLQIVNVLLRRRWMIIGGTLALTAGVAGYSYLLPSTYSASATFLPSRAAPMSNRMGAMVGAAGSIDDADANTSPEYYTALFKSRAFLEAILHQRFMVQARGERGEQVELLETFEIEAESAQERVARGAEAFLKTITIVAGKSKSLGPQLITVTATAGEPQLAADVANAFLAELLKYNESVRNSKAASNRTFVETQVGKARVLLAEAEEAFADFSTRNRKIATPDLQTEKDRLARAVKAQEEVFITLLKQLELAKIQEHEDQQTVEIIEQARAPLARTSPNRRNMVTIAGFAGVFLFGILALALEYFKTLDRDEKDVKELFENLGGIRRDVGLGRR